MHLRFFERAALLLGAIGYMIMFAAFAVAKKHIPETLVKLEHVSWSLALCTLLLLACEIMACSTFNVMFKQNGKRMERTKLMWMKPAATGVLLFMFVSCQIPLWWYKLSGQAGPLGAFIKVVVPILTVFVFLLAALYATRERRKLVYV